jgi:ADP-heptose:LPS heptosyltransferase
MLGAMQIAAYARAARSRLDVDILLVGGESEAAKAEEVMKLCGGDARVASVLTATSLPEFVAVLKQANMLLCGDTFALHVATAISLPSVCLVGPTSLAELAEFGGLVLRVTAAGLDCLGCYGNCNKTDNCMSLLTTERLVDLTARQLSIFHPE